MQEISLELPLSCSHRSETLIRIASRESLCPSIEKDLKIEDCSSSILPSNTLDFSLKRYEFLIALAKSFASHGCPAHRLEHHLKSVSTAMGMSGSEFYVLPGAILISLPFPPYRLASSSVRMVKIPHPRHNLAKLSAVNQLCRDIESDSGHITIGEAWKAIDGIHNKVYDVTAITGLSLGDKDPGRVPRPEVWKSIFDADTLRWMLDYCAVILSGGSNSKMRYPITFPIISFTSCFILFSGTWIESGIAGLMGLITALMILGAKRWSYFSNLVEFSASLLISICVGLFSSVFERVACIESTKICLSGIVMLLPGFSLTFAITEVTTKRLLCGTVGIFRSVYAAALLGLGLAIGASMSDLIHQALDKTVISPEQCKDSQRSEAPSHMWFILFYPMLIICIIFH